jgi:RHS repeat-associated protein
MQVLNFCSDERLVGDPVDVLTGSNLDRVDDFRLAGPPHFEWIRRYDSRATSRIRGLGPGFIHGLDHVLLFDLDGIQYQSGDGSLVSLPFLEQDGSSASSSGCVLTRHSPDEFVLLTPNGDVLGFKLIHEGTFAPVAWIRTSQFCGDFIYGKTGQLVEFRRNDGLCLFLDYEIDRLVSVCLPSETHGASRTLVRYVYDDRGRLQSVEDEDGARQRYEYDEHDRVVLKTDRRRYKFLYEYDGEGRCIRSRGQDGVLEVRLEYYPAERFTRVTLADGGVWQYFADEHLNLKLIVDPKGGTRRFEYDAENRMICRVDASGNRQDVYLDTSAAHANPRMTRPQTGETPLEWEFGGLLPLPAGNQADLAPAWLPPFAYDVLRMSERSHTERRVKRNIQGFALHEVDCEGHERYWTRDGEGNILTYTDRDGHTSVAKYSSWNHLVQEIDPCGGITTFEYLATERVSSVRGPGGAETRYVYDLTGNLVEVHRHGRLRERYINDPAGNLVEKKDRSDKTLIRLEIGPNNQKRSRILASGDRQSFEYDAAGLCSEVSGLAGKLSFEHDSAGRRLRDERDGIGVRHEFSGDFLARTTILDRFTVTYEHSRDGVIVTDPTGRRHSIRSDSATGVAERRFGNGVVEYLRYGIRGECLAKIGIGVHQKLIWNRRYSYSPEGDLHSSESDACGRRDYRYDSNHRLVEVKSEDGSRQQYSYDAAGNLTLAPEMKLDFGSGNRIRSTESEHFDFSERDHICLRETFQGETRYTYDSRDLLSSAKGPGFSYHALHDPFGRRTKKTVNGRTWKFFWDRDRLSAEIFPEGKVRIYVYVDDKALVPLLFVDYSSIDASSGTCYYPITDHLGCVTDVLDDLGNFVWSGHPAPFGDVRVVLSEDFHQPLRWPGHYYDEEIGLHDNRFRTYDPRLGRYLQSDPLGLAGGPNLYAYAENNPLRFVDRVGLASNHCPLKDKDDDETPEDGPDKELTTYQRHLGDCEAAKSTAHPAKLTELHGEIDAATFVKDNYPGYEMALGYQPGRGFDQVWVKTDNEGKEHILIVEAKGRHATTDEPAELGTTKHMGEQMSPKWTQENAKRLQNDPETADLGTSILNGMEKGPPPHVTGIVVTGGSRIGDNTVKPKITHDEMDYSSPSTSISTTGPNKL